MINVDFDNNLMDNKTGQIVANETAPSQENTVKYPGAASAPEELLPQSLQPTPLRRRQTASSRGWLIASRWCVQRELDLASPPGSQPSCWQPVSCA